MSEDIAAASRRTNPRGFLVHAILGMRNAAAPMAVLLFTKMDDGIAVALAISAAIGAAFLVVSAIVAYIRWTRLTYRIQESDIRVESGIFSRQARSVPFDRIQDVATSQNFIARLFGLVAITFETGGGSGEDISLSYLDLREAERLRDTIRDRRDSEGEGTALDAGAEPARDQGRLLFAMAPRRVLTFGLFNFSLIVISVAGGLLAQFDDVLPFDVWDIEGWRERLAGPGAWLAGLGFLAQAIGVMALLAILGVFGIATGIVRTVLAQWDFRLERTDKGFRRRRGLFTRTDVTLPVRRVQAAMLSARAREAAFGWCKAALVSLAADAGASHHEIAPFARREEIDPLVREAGLRVPHEGLEWSHVSPIHAVATGLLTLRDWLVPAVLILVAQYFIAPEGWPGSPLLALIPAAIGSWKAVRSAMALLCLRYAIDDEQVYVRSGWLSWALQLVPREKIQSVSVGQGPLARRFGYAFLNLGVAGAVVHVQGMDLPRAYALREELLGSMRRRDFSRLN